MSDVSNLRSSSVVYTEPMHPTAKATMYLSIGLVSALAITIIFYSILTHATMSKLLTDPSLARLTSERFFTLLTIALPIIGVGTALALALKVHHSCYGNKYLVKLPNNAVPFQ